MSWVNLVHTKKACIFPAKRHQDSVVFRFPFNRKALHIYLTFLDQSVRDIYKMTADSVDTDQTAPMQTDQGLHYMQTLSTLFAYKDKMSKY